MQISQAYPDDVSSSSVRLYIERLSKLCIVMHATVNGRGEVLNSEDSS